MKKVKKTVLRLACLLVGLNTFTACYGPAPLPDEEMAARLERTTKAVQDETQDDSNVLDENEKNEDL